MKTFISYFLAIVAAIAASTALAWVLAFNNLVFTSFFAPKQEQIRRDVFEQSKAYRDGVIQELYSLRVEYMRADPSIQPALASAIRHKSAGLPKDVIPADLALFLSSI